MSAFMVEDGTINRVVTWLSWEVTKSLWLKRKIEETLHVYTTTRNWEEILGHAMFELNIDGVNARYGDGEAIKFRKLTYRYTPATVSEIQVLKSLQCFLYQCAEGEVPKKPLYQFFDTVVEKHLMSNIITDLAEYEHAKWE